MTEEEALEALRLGALTVRGRLAGASNAVLYAAVEHGGREVACVYKPVAGERPLWDFPDGTLAQREVAAYEVCRALEWDLVPPTVLRDGPHGPGMCQLWIGPAPRRPAEPVPADSVPAEPGGPDGAGGAGGPGDGEPAPGETELVEEPEPETVAAGLLALVEGDDPGPGWKAVGYAETGPGRTALLVHADDERLRRLAALDAVINNGDRKGGHLLQGPGGRLYAIDHGVSFHAEDKLRTLLWGWAGEPLPAQTAKALAVLRDRLAAGGPLATRMGELITPAELAALRGRVDVLLDGGRYPQPGGEWPAIPWPLV